MAAGAHAAIDNANPPRLFLRPASPESDAVDIQFDGTMSSNDICVLLSACLGGAGIACLARERGARLHRLHARIRRAGAADARPI